MRVVNIRILMIPLLLVIFLALVLFRHKDYRLNRTIRETTLCLTQISHLSRKTGSDFKAIFQERHLTINIFDKDLGNWKRYLEWPYKKGIICFPQGWEFFFSNGSFREYRSNSWPGKAPKYIIVQFQFESSSKKKGIIFYRDGNWRALG
jgi:hypothetical protein